MNGSLALLDDFPLPVWHSGVDGKCDYFNSTWLWFTGRTLDKEMGDGWTQGVHADDLVRVVEDFRQALLARRPFELEYRLRRSDGEYRLIVDQGRPCFGPDGRFEGYIGSCRDISEREHREELLRRSREDLRSLTRQIVTLQENNRREMARELHDRVGQNLSTLNLNLSIIQSRLSPELLRLCDKPLGDSLRLVAETMDAIRDITAELRPPVLEDYGLAAALRWQSDKMTRRSGLRVRVKAEANLPRWPAGSELALFRVAQEAMNNIEKHAHASAVDISLENHADGLCLTIADDGSGFDPMASKPAGTTATWGLAIMRERTETVGGQFQLEGVPGQGTPH